MFKAKCGEDKRQELNTIQLLSTIKVNSMNQFFCKIKHYMNTLSLAIFGYALVSNLSVKSNYIEIISEVFDEGHKDINNCTLALASDWSVIGQ